MSDMKKLKKSISLTLLSFLLLLCLSAWGTAYAGIDKNIIVESFETVENWLAMDADKISLNTDKAYVKEGEASLCLRYPAAKRGNNLYITPNEWDKGGFRLVPPAEKMIITKVGMWVYGCGDNNMKMQIATKSPEEESNVTSETRLLNFTGWKYISFEVSDKTDALFYINVSRVDGNIENPQDKYIYIDALSAEYDFDMSQVEELEADSSIAEGATRVPLDVAPEFTFNNIIDEDAAFDIQISPQIGFSLEKMSDKQYQMRFDRQLAIATQYQIKFSGVTDIYGQKLDKAFSFTTLDFGLEVLKLSSNGTEIERITEAEAGELSLQLSLQSYAEVNPNNEALVMCSIFDANGYMTGFACQRVQLSQQQQTVTLALNTSQAPVRGEVFVLDSINNRRIVEHTGLGGE